MYFGQTDLSNSVDPDQTPHNAASNQGLRLFSTHSAILKPLTGSKMEDKYKIKSKDVNI